MGIRFSNFFLICIASLFFRQDLFACILVSKNVEDRKYVFKCNEELMEIQCKVKIQNVCKAQLTEKLKKSNFTFSEDQLKDLELYSNPTQKRILCQPEKEVCSVTSAQCNMDEFFEKRFKKESERFAEEKRCNNSILNAGAGISFFVDFSKDNKFSSGVCKSELALENLKKQIDYFKKMSFAADFSSEDNFYNACFIRSDLSKGRTLGNEEKEKFGELTKILDQELNSIDNVRKLVCTSENNYFDEDKTLNFDKLFCDAIERSKVGANLEKANIRFNCSESIQSGKGNSRAIDDAGAKIASYNWAQEDTKSAEQKPLPQIIQNESGRSVGLMPTLAQIDKIAPGDFSIPTSKSGSTATEHVIAVGAARNSAAVQAGQAFAPIYEKLSRIADAASDLGNTSGTQLAKSRTPNSAGAKDFGGVKVQGNLAKNIKANSVDTGSVGGARGGSSLGRNSVGGDSSGSDPSPGYGSPDISVVRVVKDRLNEIDTRDPKEVRDFFFREAKSIEGIRAAFYGDKEVRDLLARKGITIVGQNSAVVGADKTQANYVFSDNGKTFVFISGKKAK